MRLLAMLIIGFCGRHHGLMNKDQCVDWVRDCYVYIRPAYNENKRPADRCMQLYQEIYYDDWDDESIQNKIDSNANKKPYQLQRLPSSYKELKPFKESGLIK